MTPGEILKPPLNRPKPLNPPLILGDIFDFLRPGMSIVGSLLGEGLDPCARLLTRCVPFTSYLLTAKRLVLGALLLWGAPGGVQPVPAGTLDAARRGGGCPSSRRCGGTSSCAALSSDLNSNDLVGAIPTELGLLTALTNL